METTLKAVISLDDQLSGTLGKIQGNLSKFQSGVNTSFNKIDKAFGGTFDGFNNLVKTTAVGAVGMGAAFAGFGVKTAAGLQTMAVNFETLTGSAEKGKQVFSDLKKMGATTPFETQDLAKATQTMLSFGITADKSKEYLTMLGDVSMGNKDKLSGLTLAFSQVQSTGRLMGQDLLQMINQGFNPLTIIAQKTGRSMTDLKKDMEDGKITTEMVTDAFKTATSEGGLFHKGMERGSQTIEGRFSTLVDTAKNLAAGFVGLKEDGTILEGSLLDLTEKGVNGVIKALEGVNVEEVGKKVVDTIKAITDAVKDGIEFYKQYKDIIDAVAIFLGTLVVGLYAFHTAMKVIAGAKAIFLALTSPIGLVVLAIAAIVAVGYLVWKHWDKIKKFFLDTFDAIKGGASVAWNWIKNKTTEIWNGIKNTIFGAWNAIKNAVTGALNFIKNMFVSAWNFVVGVVKGAIDGIIWIFENWHRVLGFVLGFILGTFINGIIGAFTIIKNTILGIPGFVSQVWTTISTFWTNGTTYIANKTGEVVGRIVQFFLNLPQNIANIWNTIRDMANNGMGSLHGSIMGGINWIVDRFREIPGKISNIWNGLRDGFNHRIGELHNSVSNGLNWIRDRFAELPGRALNALGGMFNTGKEALKGFWNGILSGLGSFAGAVRAGLRAAGVPGLASGTNFVQGGSYLVGETGPELVDIPRGAKVTRASETRDLMKGQTINISINNPMVRNDNDIQMIIDEVTKAFNSTQRLKRLGV
jgi:tape measure domain-containing protein